ncbi:MAG TPA: Wzz/FepE/Etk N-terminal domain-containing protein [Pyrinomonadaceae bacterium]|nr:Wzz/FepE/Etk N-terminal domain-containing protein [Pyrinomonadaceae bacterium]
MRFSTDKSLFEQISEAVLRRKLLILSVFLLVVVSGMIATLLITPKYEATMSILVSRDRIDAKISPSEKLPDVVQAAISDEEFNSELELIKSSEVITGAVKELDLVNNQAPKNDSWLSDLRAKIKTMVYDFTPRVTAQTKETKNQTKTQAAGENFTIEKTVNRVASNLDVVPIKKSRIIKVSYTDTDPIRAKNTLEQIYQKYVDLHVHLNQKLQAGQVFNEQSNEFSQKLKSSTNTLKNFDAQHGLAGAETEVQRELLLKRLFETQAQLSTTQTEIVETEQRIADLQAKVEAQPEQIQTGSISKYVSALDRMKEELVQLEQQRTQLLQKYQPTSRLVQDNEGRIQQLKKSIAEETANPPQEKSFALNDLRRRLMTDLYSAQTNLVALKERERKLSPQVAEMRSQSALFNSKSIERVGLERERNVNEEAYLLYQKKARENEISQILNKEQVMNFGLVDAPRTDGMPKNPKPLLNLLVLIFIGATAGFASAIVLDKLSGANFENEYDLISSAYELEQRLNLPLLATISIFEKTEGELASKPEFLALPPAKDIKNNNL